MKMSGFGIFLIAAALSPAAFVGHSQGTDARLILKDGSSRIVRIEGVGCSAAICSRTLIEGESQDHSRVKIRIDSIAAIRQTTPGSALFVMKDGSERRLFLLKDFRVLYIPDKLGGTRRLDLAAVNSLEFPRLSP